MKLFLFFLIGLFAPLAVVIVAGESGLLSIDARSSPGRLESLVARRWVHRGLARRAVGLVSPVASDDSTLLAGMKLYREGCAGCHGGPVRGPSVWGTKGFHPRVPQLAQHPTSLGAPEAYVVVRDGIRYSAMGSWRDLLEDADLWKVATFVSRLDSLPPAVDAIWRSPPRRE